MSALAHIIHSKVPSLYHSPHWPFPHAFPLTALTPESCWPIIMTTIEMSCHRKPLKVHRLSTEKCPSSFSDWSSWRISSISSSTSSQPLSFRRASWERKASYEPQRAGLQWALLLQIKTEQCVRHRQQCFHGGNSGIHICRERSNITGIPSTSNISEEFHTCFTVDCCQSCPTVRSIPFHLPFH